VVTIAHEEIPGFMKAMTMPFTPRDRSNLAELAPGDEVEGPLEVVREGGAIKDYNLLRLEVTNPAPRVLSVDPKTGKAALVPKPVVLRPGEAVPDFAMTTQDGAPLTLSDLRGNTVVLTFIYTRCPLPDYCPAIDRKFRRLADRLGAVKGRAARVRLLSISFDPEHDTPEALRAHAALVGARPPLWTFAVASHDELRKVAGRLGLVYGPMPNEIVHNLCTAVVAPDGTLARLEVGAAGKGWDPDDLLRTVLAAGGAGR
jgi:protein SCO1/2